MGESTRSEERAITGAIGSRTITAAVFVALFAATLAVPVTASPTAFVPPSVRHTPMSAASAGTTAAVSPALLRVTTSIDVSPGTGVPSTVLVDGVPRDVWGLNWVKMAPGSHVISFTDVTGFTTPAPIAVTTTSGQTTAVVGTFAARGFLRVITNPALPSTIFINGTPRDDWGDWMAVPPGTYTVSFGAVAGWAVPAPVTATVVADQTTTVTGQFTSNPSAPGPDPSAFGLLRVTTATSDGVYGVYGTQILVDGILADAWGLNWVKMAPGAHTVSFSDVPGLGTPAPQVVTVVAGQTATVTGTFARLGSLRAVTDPAVAATISVDGIPRDDWGMWVGFAPGPHTVSFENLSGMAVPTAQNVTVTAGALTLVTGEYSASAGSLNWAGYVNANDFAHPAHTVTGAWASWVVPLVQPTSKTQYSSVWVGIGGFFANDTSLIQTGTEEDSGSGSTFYAAWFEILPAVSTRITSSNTTCPVLPTTNFCLVKPGDVIVASVVLENATTKLWTVALADVTQSWSFSMDLTYASSEQSAEWIVERPALCGPSSCRLTTLALFTTVSLGQDATASLGTNTATIGGYYGTLGAFARRTVLMYTGTTLTARPSDLSPDATSFTVTKVG